jgi:hypothetical protein
MFDPNEQWVFDFNDIPIDHNISDYCLGVLELARSLTYVTPGQLKIVSSLWLCRGVATPCRSSSFVRYRTTF